MSGDCTCVCFTSRGDAVAGSIDSDLCTYSGHDYLLYKQSAPGSVWGICEYKQLIYVQCGDKTVEVYTYDLKKKLRTWELRFKASQLAVSNDLIYTINLDDGNIVKCSLDGQFKALLEHPSFVKPYSLKPYREDSIVVCDPKANAVFFFKKDCCVWQLELVNCSGVAVDWKAGNIWVKVFNKNEVTVLSQQGNMCDCLLAFTLPLECSKCFNLTLSSKYTQ